MSLLHVFTDGTDLPLVCFDGIFHLIIEEAMNKETAEAKIREWSSELEADALGLMFFTEETMELKPLVYVPAANTLFWETACGSGSSAVGAYLASVEGKPADIALKQPGGILKIRTDRDGAIRLSGTVRSRRRGTVIMDF